MSKPSQVVVLAEDSRHQSFVRHYLYRAGYRPHDIRFEKLPSGAGSGEQWVRHHYAGAVAQYRQRAAKAQTALIVVIDADSETVAQRSRRLAAELKEANIADRTANERIVHLIPKRHIETWILCLNGHPVDEKSDYKHLVADSPQSVISATKFLYEHGRPAQCGPSLAIAIEEFARLTA